MTTSTGLTLMQECRCQIDNGRNADAVLTLVWHSGICICSDTGLIFWMPEGRCPAMNLASALIRLFSVKLPTFRLFGNTAAPLLVFTGQPVYICLFQRNPLSFSPALTSMHSAHSALPFRLSQPGLSFNYVLYNIALSPILSLNKCYFLKTMYCA